MVRWRWCLLLAMLLVLPVRTAKDDDDDEDKSKSNRREENEEEDEDDDDDDDEDTSDKSSDRNSGGSGRRSPNVAPAGPPSPKSPAGITRTVKKQRPLECYVCAYKVETPLRACLDPTKFRVHTITCHSVDDKCFTSVISKGNTYEAVVRGCRSSCVGTPESTCCELNRCNNQAFAIPLIQPRALASSKSNKTIPPNVVFFVTILLLLQTVVKVPFV